MKHFPGSQSFDLVGFGREMKPKAVYDKDYFLDFIENKIVAPSIIVGHSMGAMLAKEFALRYPDLVKRIYAIAYPLQENPQKMERVLRRDKFLSLYLDGNVVAKMLCHGKCCYKYILLPFGIIFYRNYFLSFWHYFSHTYHSASSSIKNTILRDEYDSIFPVRDKIVLIAGEKDCQIDRSLLQELTYHEIAGMGHNFFGYEEEIADIIKCDLK